MNYLCENCVRDFNLKKLILNKSCNKIDKCEVCYSKDVYYLENSDRNLHNLFRALIRYYYSEWEYNEHHGGDGLERLFLKDNPITNYSELIDIEKYEETILSFIENGYENYEDGISLFAGYTHDGIHNPLLKSIKNNYAYNLEALQRQIVETNYFVFEEDTKRVLSLFINKLRYEIKKGEVLYRARIGFEKKANSIWGWGDEWHYSPYCGKDISAPSPKFSSGGRINREGVSFLYLSSKESTAIAEIRPHPGHHISVGSFISEMDSLIADFTKITLMDYYHSDKLLDQFFYLKSIDELFSLPVPPDQKYKYSLTQFLGDIIRSLGFEGVGFKSSISDGHNYAFFNPNSFAYVKDSGKVFYVKDLKYDCTPQTLMQKNEEYMNSVSGELF